MRGIGELAVSDAILVLLRADATLAGLLADHATAGSPSVPAVYDFVPQAVKSESAEYFPYVEIGDYTSAEADTDDINGAEHTVILHVWDLRRGKKRAKQVRDAIYDVLQNRQLEPVGHHAVYCFFEYSDTVPDPDVLKQHIVIRIRIFTQQQ